MILKYMAMAILVLASLRQAIRCSLIDNTHEDDKFIYTFFVTITFFMTQMKVI